MPRRPGVEEPASDKEVVSSGLAAAVPLECLGRCFAFGPIYLLQILIVFFWFIHPLLLGTAASMCVEWNEPRPVRSHIAAAVCAYVLAWAIRWTWFYYKFGNVEFVAPLAAAWFPVNVVFLAIGAWLGRALMAIRWRNETLPQD
jgi:hypothetical protein